LEDRVSPPKKSTLIMLADDGSTDVEKIERALKALGGRATGVEICKWISEQFQVDELYKKTMQYRINALLASKTNTFQKDSVLIEGNHRASVWRFVDPSAPPPAEKQGEMEDTNLDIEV
jgi:hypothetical protein